MRYEEFVNLMWSMNNRNDWDCICIRRCNLHLLYERLYENINDNKKEVEILKAKILVYEELIKKSNFASMLEEGDGND